jgi:hypothetical protein
MRLSANVLTAGLGLRIAVRGERLVFGFLHKKCRLREVELQAKLADALTPIRLERTETGWAWYGATEVMGGGRVFRKDSLAIESIALQAEPINGNWHPTEPIDSSSTSTRPATDAK